MSFMDLKPTVMPIQGKKEKNFSHDKRVFRELPAGNSSVVLNLKDNINQFYSNELFQK